jgi:archaellin
LRFVTSAGNYFQTSIATPASGTYTIASVLKSAFTTTGSPDWSNITQVDIVVTSTAGGIGSIDFDGVRIEDTDANQEESVLVSRSILGSPLVKTADLPLDIEYAVTF